MRHDPQLVVIVVVAVETTTGCNPEATEGDDLQPRGPGIGIDPARCEVEDGRGILQSAQANGWSTGWPHC